MCIHPTMPGSLWTQYVYRSNQLAGQGHGCSQELATLLTLKMNKTLSQLLVMFRLQETFSSRNHFLCHICMAGPMLSVHVRFWYTDIKRHTQGAWGHTGQPVAFVAMQAIKVHSDGTSVPTAKVRHICLKLQRLEGNPDSPSGLGRPHSTPSPLPPPCCQPAPVPRDALS